MTGGGASGGGGGGARPAPFSGGPLGGEDEAIARLDREFSGWAGRLTAREREAIRIFQATDRRYEMVNAVRRGLRPIESLSDAEAVMVERVSSGLDSAIEKGTLASSLRVWRGGRRAEPQLGVPPGRIDDIRGAEITLRGYFATSVRRQVALDEFTSRIRPEDSVLLEVIAPSGASAAWVSLAGDPTLRWQAELLLPDPTRILITEVRREGALTIVKCELIA